VADQLDILAIAAHPDDVEITCGGLLIKEAKRGRKVGALDLTQGEMGTHGNESDRAREAKNAAEALGLVYRHNLELPDSALENSHEYKLAVAQIIRNTRPELVILPHWSQRHPDHVACTQIGYDACFIAGLKKANLEGDPHRPRKIIYASYFRNTDYSFLVDITDSFEQKCQAVAAYVSQFGKSGAEGVIADRFKLPETSNKDIFAPGISIFELMQVRAMQLGQLVGVRYAEAYTIKEHILIDDPQKMAVRSI
jgi:bacillithiol biosynthesis deacetylase BshB1